MPKPVAFIRGLPALLQAIKQKDLIESIRDRMITFRKHRGGAAQQSSDQLEDCNPGVRQQSRQYGFFTFLMHRLSLCSLLADSKSQNQHENLCNNKLRALKKLVELNSVR